MVTHIALLVLIIRHGDAEKGSVERQDEERRLTLQGAEDLRRNLRIVKEILSGRRIELVLSSSFERAKESAKIVMEILQSCLCEVEDSLTPDSEPLEIFHTLSKYNRLKSVALVSHNPLALRLLETLLRCDTSSFAFETSAIAIVNVQEICENPSGLLLTIVQNLKPA